MLYSYDVSAGVSTSSTPTSQLTSSSPVVTAVGRRAVLHGSHLPMITELGLPVCPSIRLSQLGSHGGPDGPAARPPNVCFDPPPRKSNREQRKKLCYNFSSYQFTICITWIIFGITKKCTITLDCDIAGTRNRTVNQN